MAAGPVGKANAETVPLVQLAESRVLSEILQLARDIGRPCAFIGLCFALACEYRPFLWVGDARTNLVEMYALGP